MPNGTPGPMVRKFPLRDASCVRCNNSSDLLRHHKDGDHDNWSEDNVEILCRSCHSKEHARRGAFKKSPEHRAKLASAAKKINRPRDGRSGKYLGT